MKTFSYAMERIIQTLFVWCKKFLTKFGIFFYNIVFLIIFNFIAAMQRLAVLDMMRPFAAYGGLWQQAGSRVLGFQAA